MFCYQLLMKQILEQPKHLTSLCTTNIFTYTFGKWHWARSLIAVVYCELSFVGYYRKYFYILGFIRCISDVKYDKYMMENWFHNGMFSFICEIETSGFFLPVNVKLGNSRQLFFKNIVAKQMIKKPDHWWLKIR